MEIEQLKQLNSITDFSAKWYSTHFKMTMFEPVFSILTLNNKPECIKVKSDITEAEFQAAIFSNLDKWINMNYDLLFKVNKENKTIEIFTNTCELLAAELSRILELKEQACRNAVYKIVLAMGNATSVLDEVVFKMKQNWIHRNHGYNPTGAMKLFLFYEAYCAVENDEKALQILQLFLHKFYNVQAIEFYKSRSKSDFEEGFMRSFLKGDNGFKFMDEVNMPPKANVWADISKV